MRKRLSRAVRLRTKDGKFARMGLSTRKKKRGRPKKGQKKRVLGTRAKRIKGQGAKHSAVRKKWSGLAIRTKSTVIDLKVRPIPRASTQRRAKRVPRTHAPDTTWKQSRAKWSKRATWAVIGLSAGVHTYNRFKKK